MEAHVVRLMIEQEQLIEKINKLKSVFHTKLWETFSEETKALLSIQHSAMLTYSECLEQRIKILK